jgi:hypothetical protein
MSGWATPSVRGFQLAQKREKRRLSAAPTWSKRTHGVCREAGRMEARHVRSRVHGDGVGVHVGGIHRARRQSGRRRRCRRIERGLQLGTWSGLLLSRRLLVNRVEMAFFAQTDAVLAAALGVVCGYQASDLAPATMHFNTSTLVKKTRIERNAFLSTHHRRQRCGGSRACCASYQR